MKSGNQDLVQKLQGLITSCKIAIDKLEKIAVPSDPDYEKFLNMIGKLENVQQVCEYAVYCLTHPMTAAPPITKDEIKNVDWNELLEKLKNE